MRCDCTRRVLRSSLAARTTLFDLLGDLLDKLAIVVAHVVPRILSRPAKQIAEIDHRPKTDDEHGDEREDEADEVSDRSEDQQKQKRHKPRLSQPLHHLDDSDRHRAKRSPQTSSPLLAVVDADVLVRTLHAMHDDLCSQSLSEFGCEKRETTRRTTNR